MRADTSAEFHALVEQELNRERAGALGRAGRRLGRAIADCDDARAELRAAGNRGDRRAADAALDDYRLAYATYQQAHRDFCIQREANRLRDHSLIGRYYPPPTPPEDLPPLSSTPGGQ
jgi:hypothetical protein